jgi:sulfatase maturation enzyme AslB (radical SAM superfamily)
MSVVGLLPDDVCEKECNGIFLTFVVAAPGGCNLRCAFCSVRQRREIGKHSLRPNDFVRFIEEVDQRSPIYALAIQGYEPLLPESLPYTEPILTTGQRLGLPTTLVTNGFFLGGAVGLLKALAPTKISISLDSALAETHDRVRGVTGAWAVTVRNIKRAVESLAPRTSIAVSSVLLPSRVDHLQGMPARLREIGVRQWIVNPLLRFGPANTNGPVGNRQNLLRDLLGLQEMADQASIHFTVDDEFDRLGRESAIARQREFAALRIRTLPAKVDIYRVSPSGQAWKGEDILTQADAGSPHWRPGADHAGDFLATLSHQTNGPTS